MAIWDRRKLTREIAAKQRQCKRAFMRLATKVQNNKISLYALKFPNLSKYTRLKYNIRSNSRSEGKGKTSSGKSEGGEGGLWEKDGRTTDILYVSLLLLSRYFCSSCLNTFEKCNITIFHRSWTIYVPSFAVTATNSVLRSPSGESPDIFWLLAWGVFSCHHIAVHSGHSNVKNTAWSVK